MDATGIQTGRDGSKPGYGWERKGCNRDTKGKGRNSDVDGKECNRDMDR